MTRTPDTIAATSTLAMVRAAQARGFGTEDLLQKAGLTCASLEDPDARIPGSTVVALWNALRERTGDYALQLAAPVALPFGGYRVIDYLVATSPTVGEGLGRFARFFELIAHGATLSMGAGPNERRLVLASADGGAVPPVYVDYVFAALVGRIRMRIRRNLEVLRVDLRQPRPTWAQAYEDTFRAPVVFGAQADRLCFTEAEWDAPTESGDEALAALVEEHARLLTRQIPVQARGFRAEVERAIAASLPDGRSAAFVARTLHVSVRTLQRKLSEEGATFRDVADVVSARLALRYLENAAVSIAEVAFLLGFADATAFNRAFRRWTGQSPGRWRRQNR